MRRAIFLSGVFGEAMNGADYHRYLRIIIAQKMGWTLAAVDGAGIQDWLDVLAVIQGTSDLRGFGD